MSTVRAWKHRYGYPPGKRPWYARGAGRPDLTRAFTLIEVLVVVAIIALIVSILLPALKQAREHASGAVCQSGMRQLTIAMLTYTAEFGRLPGNNGIFWGAWARSGSPGTGWPDWKPGDSWLGLRDPPTTWDISQQDQLWAFIDATVPKMGSLYRYVRNEKVYLCCKDQKGLPNSEDTTGGGGNGRFSYTVNTWVGFKSPEELQSFKYVANFQTKAGALPPKVSTIPAGTKVMWSASQMPLLIEEHPWNNTNHGRPNDGWAADSYLVLRHYPSKRVGRANFTFLDGHGELRRYPYVADPTSSWASETKLQGLDLFNEFRFPYSYDGNTGGRENEEAFAYKFRYPYND
jgi:prepilin-type N-terminal cleavage/methylation domain-containing protein/prepilin-type processing-associated H-X9-DG protein